MFRALVFTSLSLICATGFGVDYLRDVKPLLQEKCYACHGALKAQGGLRLDTAASLMQGGDSGKAVAAGDPDNSFLIEVLTGDAGFQMPPENEGSPLTADQVALIRAWISEGAPVPDHEEPQADPKLWWSYQPIERPALPSVTDQERCRNEVDFFVAARREQQGLRHTQAATKSAWLRRVYLDLIGLPPTRDELHRFQQDDSLTAWETVVDDLLDRPQYGERWGRHWMDIWRYSDWYGSRGANEIRYSQRHIWRWRDWIVRSLNEDKGYDRMVREMLAADEISNGDVDMLPATGYLGRSWYKFDRNVWLFETVERTGEAFLGLTLRCCRCHDHKFDPVTQEEYYRFRAFFEPHNVRTDPISARTGTEKDPTQGQVLTDGISLVYDREAEAPTYLFERGDDRSPDETNPLTPGTPTALGAMPPIQSVRLPAIIHYPMLRPAVRDSLIEKAKEAVAKAEQRLRERSSEGQLAAERLAAATRTASDVAEVVNEGKVLLEDDFAAADPQKWQILSGSWDYRDGCLTQTSVTSFATLVSQDEVTGDFDVHLRYRVQDPGTYRSVGFSFDYLDQGNSQDIYTSTGDARQSVQAFHRIDGKQVYPREGIVFTPLTVGEEVVLDVSVVGSSLTIDLNQERKLDYVIPEPRRDGRFALWIHQGTAEFLDLRIRQRVESLATLERRSHEAQQAVTIAQAELELAQHNLDSVSKRVAAEVARYIDQDPGAAARLAHEAAVAEATWKVSQAALDVIKSADSPDKLAEAEKTLADARSALENPTDEFTPLGTVFPETSSGRRSALADWIVSEHNPRAARVAANHIWGRHFGRPLVATPENFGLNGRKPTHPDLLDWLATELLQNGWQMKPLHRKLVLSATYRMASAPDRQSVETNETDPDTPQPFDIAHAQDPDNTFLWRMNTRRMEAEVVRDSLLDMTIGGAEIPETQGETNFRRSLYFRNAPNEKMDMLEVFDAANPNACYRRKQSVVPNQSLAMMNSGLAQDSARLLVEKIGTVHSNAEFITAAFETVLGRPASRAESERCLKYLEDQIAHDQKQPVFPEGSSVRRKPSADPVTRARENLVHVLFLHNDFVTIR